ncbi:hypothetical protein [Spongiactinospora gelatinilytica]|uniref:hypothetical protein n=1 Tax=Spongiactinospora gelatinilytica TaxID=2666298 RepID=UPI001F2A5E84|nr:hypothetical protein [Spongiactinospora gelatinilytica]
MFTWRQEPTSRRRSCPEALAGLFLISYVGLSPPAIGVGIATRFVPATTAMGWLTGVLVVLLAAFAVLSRRR